jgi:phospholipid transport system substrate-binding protein
MRAILSGLVGAPPLLLAGRMCMVAVAAMLALALEAPIAAATPPDPMAEVKATVDKMVAILADPALKSNPAEHRAQLTKTVEEHFDFAEMGRLALGVHWRGLSDQQHKEFVDLFTRFIEASYIGKVESYNGQPIEFLKEWNDGSGYAQVNTDIRLGQGSVPASLNYRLILEREDWKVYDVTVDNISLVANYRNQFSRVINNQGFDAMMNEMRAKQQGLDDQIAK